MLVTPKTKTRTIASAILMIASIVAVGVAWQYIRQMGSGLEQQILTVAAHADREQKYNELSRLVGATAEQREELAGYILSEEETINFITGAEQIAAAQGVEYTTDQLTQKEQDGPFDLLLIDFTMKGAEADVLHMLRLLETTPYHSQLKKLNLNRATLEDEGFMTARVQLEVTLRTL